MGKSDVVESCIGTATHDFWDKKSEYSHSLRRQDTHYTSDNLIFGKENYLSNHPNEHFHPAASKVCQVIRDGFALWRT